MTTLLPLNKKNTTPTIVPASEAQKQIWLATKMQKESWRYNIVMAYYIHGEIQVSLLEEAVSQLASKQAALRTNFKLNEQGELEQLIHAQSTVTLTYQDNWGPAFSLHNEIEKAIKTIFDLEHEPLIRFHLYRLKKNKYILVIIRHHLISDGWSSNIITQQLSALYNALENKTDYSEKPFLQFSNYCLEEKNYLETDLFHQQVEILQQKINKMIPVATQFHDQLESSSEEAEVVQLSLTHDVVDIIQRSKKKLGCSLNTILYSLFCLLVSHIFHRNQVVVALPFSGRGQKEYQNTIGNFVTTLPILIEIDSKQSYADFAKNIEKKIHAMKKLQHIPFSKIKKNISPRKSNPTHSLLDFMCVQQIALREPLEINKAYTKCIYHGNHSSAIAKFWLETYSNKTGIHCKFHYKKNIFSSNLFQSIAKNYEALVKYFLQNVEKKMQDISIYRKNIDTFAIYSFSSVEEKISAISSQYPENIAVRFGEKTLTYKQLNAQANQIANYFISQNLKPGDVIATTLSRSPTLIACILACLKIRATYVPIDLTYPTDQQADFILKNSRAKLVIVDSQRTFITQTESNIVTDKTILEHSGELSTYMPKVIAEPDDIAYMIYTSGTTGAPKGVAVPHKNLAMLLHSTQDLYHVTPTDVVAMCHSAAFDFSIWEIFLSLWHGATLEVFSEAQMQNPQTILATIIEKVSILNQTPLSLYCLSMYLEQLKPPALENSKLRLIILGGEAVNFTLLTPWFKIFSKDQLTFYNMYGITEGTIHCTHMKISAQDLKTPKLLIGEPLPGIEIAILNEQQQLCAPDEAGEIYIGGYCVAQGYHEQPQLTTQHFKHFSLPGYFSTYWLKTGDAGKKHGQNSFEYLGRLDRQVKIRGYRIECSLIEQKILLHPGVKLTHVTVATYGPEDKRLIAYVVGSLQSEDLKSLKAHLSSTLPNYMVPANIILLDKLSLNQNGKIDLKALPRLQLQDSEIPISQNYTLQEKILDIWKNVLQTDNIDIAGNFFDNGGDSLLIAKLHLQLTKKLDCQISLMDLFMHPTVGQLVDFIEQKTTK